MAEQGYDKLEKSLKENNISSDVKQSARELTRLWSYNFNKQKKDIDGLLIRSSKLRATYIELNQHMEKFADLLNKSGQNVKELSKQFFASEEEINKNIDAIAKLKKIEIELAEIAKNQKNFKNQSSIEYQALEAAKVKLENAKKEFTNSSNKGILDSGLGKLMLSESDKNKKIQEELKIRNEISQTIQSQTDDVKKYEKNISDANQTLAKQSSIWNNIKKIAAGVWHEGKKGIEYWKNANDASYTTGRSIGLATSQIKGLQNSIIYNYGKMSTRLGMTQQEIFKFQSGFVQATSRANILTQKEVESLAGVSKLIGDGGASTNEMLKNMDALGASSQTVVDYLYQNRLRAQAIGLDAQKSAAMLANNIKMASKYTFKEGVNGISKMTLLSQRLKFNMESIGSAADKFSTIEGAITTSANLQVLGGSYAAQFGNPLEAMNLALTDMEGFTKKIVDTVADKAIFNKKTGIVEMSPIDKAMLREVSKQLGISYDELWNMASQQAKIQDIDAKLNRNVKFSEEDKAFISANAKYNTQTQTHQLTYFDEQGNEVTADIKTLNTQTLKEIKKQSVPEKAIQGDVHAIHDMLSEYLGKEVRNTNTVREKETGLIESKNNAIAQAIDPMMQRYDETLDILSNIQNIGQYAAIASLVTSIGGLGTTAWLGNKFRKSLTTRINPNMGGGGGKINLFGKFKNFFRNGTKIASSSTKALSKMGYLGKALATVVAVGGVIAGLNSSDDETNYDEILKGSEDTQSELEKHTELLTIIANNGGSNGRYNTRVAPNNALTNQMSPKANPEAYQRMSNAIQNGGMTSKELLMGTGAATAVGLVAGSSFAAVPMAAIEMYTAHERYGKQLGAIQNSNLSYNEKDGLITEAKNKRNEDYGGAIGGAVGGVAGGAALGAALGSVVPVFGTAIGALIGGAAGYFGGGYIGRNWNNWFGNDNSKELQAASNTVTTNANTSYYMQAANQSINGNNIYDMAAVATCKMNDTLVSILKVVANNDGLIRERLVSSYGNGSTSVNSNSKEYNEVSHSKNTNQTDNKNVNGNINVTFNGSIKLTTDTNNPINIDIDNLLENSDFKDKITLIVMKEFNKILTNGNISLSDSTCRLFANQ